MMKIPCPSLSVPTQLDVNNLEANIVHRFLREPTATFPDNFISHANVLVGLKYIVLPKLEVGTSYQFFFKEYTFHAAYSLFMPKQFLRTQAMIQFFGDQHDLDENWDYNFLYQLNFQSEPIAGRCLPVVDLAYNGLSRKIGLGTGIDVIILKNLDFLAEYYPVLGARDTSYTGNAKVNYFSTGIKITTAGTSLCFRSQTTMISERGGTWPEQPTIRCTTASIFSGSLRFNLNYPEGFFANP